MRQKRPRKTATAHREDPSKPMVRCPLCGRSFLRLTANHARFHGYDTVAALREVNQTFGQEPVPLEVEVGASEGSRALDEGYRRDSAKAATIQDPANRSEYLATIEAQAKRERESFQVILDARRVVRHLALLDTFGKLDGELLSTERLSSMSVSELLRLRKTLMVDSRQLDSLHPRMSDSASFGHSQKDVFDSTQFVGLPIPTDPRDRDELLRKATEIWSNLSGDSDKSGEG